MAPKRPLSDPQGLSQSQKPYKGFVVGPAHLPDGTHRRKVQKIKKDLIHKAKIKRSYAKLKSREPPTTGKPPTYFNRSSPSPSHEARPDPEPASLELHPTRQAMLDAPQTPADADANSVPVSHIRGKSTTHPIATPNPTTKPYAKRPKPIPFEKEAREAQRKKVEAEKWREEIEAARIEREKKLEERERSRKAMAKARTGGKNGQRKLGRESQVLLERVRRAVGAG